MTHTYTLTLAHRHMCALKHDCTHGYRYGMILMSDQQFGLVMITVVCPPAICLICFIHSWNTISWNRKRTLRNNEHHYQVLMTTLIVPSQITCCLNSILNVIHFIIHNFNNLGMTAACFAWSTENHRPLHERFAFEWLLLHLIPPLWSARWFYMMYFFIQFKDVFSCEKTLWLRYPVIAGTNKRPLPQPGSDCICITALE